MEKQKIEEILRKANENVMQEKPKDFVIGGENGLQFIVKYDFSDSDSLTGFLVTVSLPQVKNFFKRLVYGIKYIFGNYSKCHIKYFEVKPEDYKGFQNISKTLRAIYSNNIANKIYLETEKLEDFERKLIKIENELNGKC